MMTILWAARTKNERAIVNGCLVYQAESFTPPDVQDLGWRRLMLFVSAPIHTVAFDA